MGSQVKYCFGNHLIAKIAFFFSTCRLSCHFVQHCFKALAFVTYITVILLAKHVLSDLKAVIHTAINSSLLKRHKKLIER